MHARVVSYPTLATWRALAAAEALPQVVRPATTRRIVQGSIAALMVDWLPALSSWWHDMAALLHQYRNHTASVSPCFPLSTSGTSVGSLQSEGLPQLKPPCYCGGSHVNVSAAAGSAMTLHSRIPFNVFASCLLLFGGCKRSWLVAAATLRQRGTALCIAAWQPAICMFKWRCCYLPVGLVTAPHSQGTRCNIYYGSSACCMPQVIGLVVAVTLRQPDNATAAVEAGCLDTIVRVCAHFFLLCSCGAAGR